MPPTALGDLELAVLLSVARLGDDAYGGSVRRDVSQRAGHDYSVGAVYTTLQRLEDKGFLRSWMGEPTPVRGGRARRCFRVTATGARALERAREVRNALWRGVDPEPRPT
ncbi:MAG TPA: PadR family transcriptional regulator [Gemmatimonadaceae bacterium]|nr:PadR family transcriptional regulator [Gemmatimonadaceae bacterium]